MTRLIKSDVHIDVVINIDDFLSKFIIPLKYFVSCYLIIRWLTQYKLKIWIGMLAENKMWNGSSCYGFIGEISTSRTYQSTQ